MTTIKQKTPLGVFQFELGEEALVLKQKKGSDRHQTHINYVSLIAEPDYRASSERKFLYFSLFFGSLTLLLGGISVTTTDEVHKIFSTGLAVFVFIATIVLFFRFQKSRFDVLTYFYRNGAFAFNVWRNLPDAANFSDFTLKLNALIKNAQEASLNSSSPASVSAEIDRLGSLREKGLLTDEEFARAKVSLLEQLERSGRVVGFHQ